MGVGQIITRAVGLALFAVAAILAWNYLYPRGVILSAENLLGSTECELTIDGSEIWNVSLKPGETASRPMIFGMPAAVDWLCQTASGPVAGHAYEDCGPLNRILLRPENEFIVIG